MHAIRADPVVLEIPNRNFLGPPGAGAGVGVGVAMECNDL